MGVEALVAKNKTSHSLPLQHAIACICGAKDLISYIIY